MLRRGFYRLNNASQSTLAGTRRPSYFTDASSDSSLSSMMNFSNWSRGTKIAVGTAFALEICFELKTFLRLGRRLMGWDFDDTTTALASVSPPQSESLDRIDGSPHDGADRRRA